MIALKDVLVATDFGEAAEAALAYGRELARTFGARLHVVHVVDDVMARMTSLAGMTDYLGSVNRLQLELFKSAEARLRGLLSEEDREQLRAHAVVLTSSLPARAILDYATDKNIGVIVAGTHGRGAMAHLFMGSVAERLVRSAPCPVLTVRQPEREFVLPDALQRVAHR